MSKAGTARVLNAAADHLEKVGLHKGWFFKGTDVDGTVGDLVRMAKREFADAPKCALGAIAYAARTDKQFGAADRALSALIPKRYWNDVAEWNDLPSRRKGQVVAMLRRAAEAVA